MQDQLDEEILIDYKPNLYFAVGVISVGVLLFAAATNLNSLGFISFVAIHFTLSLLVIISGVYTSVQKKTHDFLIYDPEGWVHKYFSGLWFIYIKWILIAFPFTFFALIRLSLFRTVDWVFFYSIFIVFFGVSFLVRNITRSQTSALFRISSAISITNRTLPLIVALFMVPILLIADSADSPLPIAVINFDDGGAAITNLTVWVYSKTLMIEAWAINILPVPLLRAAFTSLELLALSYTVCRVLSFFVIPVPELKRTVRPISRELSLAPLSGTELIKISAITVVLSVFVYFQMVAGLEETLLKSEAYSEFQESPEGLEKIVVQKFKDQFVKVGTLEEIEELRSGLLRIQTASQERLKETTDQIYSEMEGNVDLFLNWYYNPVSEWVRLSKTVITRDVDEYLAAKFQELVTSSEEYTRLDAELGVIFQYEEDIRRRYVEDRDRILLENKIDEPSVPYVVERDMQFSLPEDNGMDSSVSQRGALSVASGIILAKVGAKLAAKASFKVAVQFMTKALGGAATAALTTGLGGAGTVVAPGVGSVIGAGIGLVLGGAIDWGLIKWEERRNRPTFKQEILESIAESKYEFSN